MSVKVYTIGHSTHPFDQFLAILRRFGIQMVADVRAMPRSRRNPQFDQGALTVALEANDIGYVHLPGLGGLRPAAGTLTNAGWRNRSFRGYADHMQTAQFKDGLQRLIDIARERSTAIMCAEALPWRCHRSLIGDALLVHGLIVEDIFDEKVSKLHKMTPWAKVAGDTITYPGRCCEQWASGRQGGGGMNGEDIRPGDCVKLPDGRVARVREDHDGEYRVRVRRRTSKTHQFLNLRREDLVKIPCPQGWMSPEGYNRYLKKTLEKMRLRRERERQR